MPAPAKVCHVVYCTEGVAWVADQLRELRENFDVAAITGSPHGRLVDRLGTLGISCLPVSGAGSRAGAPRYMFNLVRLFRRHRFDIVQTHLFPDFILARIAAWIADVPVRLTMFASPYNLASRRGVFEQRATGWMESALIPSSEFTRGLLQQLGFGAIAPIVYYGIDDRVFDAQLKTGPGLREAMGWGSATPVIGMVAVFHGRQDASAAVPPALHGKSVKGQDILLRAALLALAEFPDAKFVFAGDGPDQRGADYFREMQKLADDLGLAGKAVFLGRRPDVPGLYRDFTLSVQASRFDNLGGVVESQLMGCPTVATRVGGMPEAVVDRQTGLLAEPDDPRSLADAILEMLRDPSWAQSLGQAGQNQARARFTLSITAASLKDIYAKNLAGAGRGYRWHKTLLRLPAGMAILFVLALLRLLPANGITRE